MVGIREIFLWRFREVAGSEGLEFREAWRTDVALSFMSVGRWSLVLGSAYVPRRESKEEERKCSWDWSWKDSHWGREESGRRD